MPDRAALIVGITVEDGTKRTLDFF